MCAPDTTGRPAHRSRASARSVRAARLSIIELMVGIVVSLLVGLAAVGSAISFTASQRQGIGTGGTLLMPRIRAGGDEERHRRGRPGLLRRLALPVQPRST